jgi:hypothetical protein
MGSYILNVTLFNPVLRICIHVRGFSLPIHFAFRLFVSGFTYYKIQAVEIQLGLVSTAWYYLKMDHYHELKVEFSVDCKLRQEI